MRSLGVCLFQQENAQPHSAYFTTACLYSQSRPLTIEPETSPIENVQKQTKITKSQRGDARWP